MAWLKTITNAWCTSSRMHESVRLPCIFGCKDSADRLDHYVGCRILWSIIHEAFGGDFTPCHVSRLCYHAPSPIKFVHIACAFEVYHSMKIGLRSIIDDAIRTYRFSEIVRVASKLARESQQLYAPHSHQNSELAVSSAIFSQVSSDNIDMMQDHPLHSLSISDDPNSEPADAAPSNGAASRSYREADTSPL